MDEYNRQKKNYTPHQAKLKIENYCAYQERAQQEVRDKLYEWGLNESDVENIIANLISDNFLNEERFAKAYVRGKFRMKGWGRIKIIHHLKSKRISQPLIKIALNEIDYDEYTNKIIEIIEKKTKTNIKSLKKEEKNRIIKHLIHKGYEYNKIIEAFSTINN